LHKYISKIILSLISIFIGLILCEITGRIIGLGSPILYQVDPLVGYRLKPNQKVKRLKNNYITTNNEGFRISKEYTNDGSDNIVFVGDSVTYGGSYINNSELFSQLFCEITKDNDYCLNGAINSWGSQNMGRFIANFNNYSDIKPKEFILVLLPGDEERNLRSFTDTPYWSNKPRQPSAINEILKFFIETKVIPNLQSRSKNDSKISHSKSFKSLIDLQREIAWGELKTYISKSQYPINLVITPPKRWFINKEKYSEEIEIYNQLINSISQEKVIKKSCNLYNKLKDKYNSDLYVDGVHLSQKGHKIWADLILSCLS